MRYAHLTTLLMCVCVVDPGSGDAWLWSSQHCAHAFGPSGQRWIVAHSRVYGGRITHGDCHHNQVPPYWQLMCDQASDLQDDRVSDSDGVCASAHRSCLPSLEGCHPSVSSWHADIEILMGSLCQWPQEWFHSAQSGWYMQDIWSWILCAAQCRGINMVEQPEGVVGRFPSVVPSWVHHTGLQQKWSHVDHTTRQLICGHLAFCSLRWFMWVRGAGGGVNWIHLHSGWTSLLQRPATGCYGKDSWSTTASFRSISQREWGLHSVELWWWWALQVSPELNSLLSQVLIRDASKRATAIQLLSHPFLKKAGPPNILTALLSRKWNLKSYLVCTLLLIYLQRCWNTKSGTVLRFDQRF